VTQGRNRKGENSSGPEKKDREDEGIGEKDPQAQNEGHLVGPSRGTRPTKRTRMAAIHPTRNPKKEHPWESGPGEPEPLGPRLEAGPESPQRDALLSAARKNRPPETGGDPSMDQRTPSGRATHQDIKTAGQGPAKKLSRKLPAAWENLTQEKRTEEKGLKNLLLKEQDPANPSACRG